MHVRAWIHSVMATKTISIDLEAYNRLVKVRQPTESFSDAIKRVVPSPLTIDEVFDVMEKNSLSAKTIRAIRRQVTDRQRPENRVA